MSQLVPTSALHLSLLPNALKVCGSLGSINSETRLPPPVKWAHSLQPHSDNLVKQDSYTESVFLPVCYIPELQIALLSGARLSSSSVGSAASDSSG